MGTQTTQTFASKLTRTFINLISMKPLEAAKYAQKTTGFYKGYYKDQTFEKFSDVPVFSKYDFGGYTPYDFLNADFEDKVIHYAETSGSSGSPTSVFFTQKDFDNMVVMIASLCPHYNELIEATRDHNVAVNLLTFGYTIAGFSLGMLLQHAKIKVAQLGSRSTIALPTRNANTISRLKPSVMASTPLDMMAILNIIREDYPDEYERILQNFKFMLSTAEPCAVSRQKQIERYFGIKHINLYASVDGFIAMPCPCGEKHIIDAVHHVELLDKDKKNIGEYGSGRLVFTTLIKRASPMVRFLIDDFVTVSKSNCPYGYTKSIAPHGRYELTAAFGDKVYGNLDFEEIIYDHGLVMDYRVAIYDDHIDVCVESYPGADNFNVNTLKQNFEDTFKLPCKIESAPYGTLADYREVRSQKSIIKILDKRSVSTQELPKIL